MKQASYIHSLKALEATCRLGSYTKASQELFVTPEAVGQMVRKLEGHLNISLFNRDTHKKRLVPTSQVLELLPQLTKAFKSLANVEHCLVRLAQNPKIIITATPSLASKWLIPRLHLINKLFKKEDIHLNLTSDLIDLNSPDADIAIRYGSGNWHGVITHRIFADEVLFPVCSKDFYEKIFQPMSKENLCKYTLIADTTITDPNYPTWNSWFEKFNLTNTKNIRYLEFNVALMAIDAAIMGQGIALVREQLVRDDLKSGALVKLFDNHEIESHWGYYVVMSENAGPRVQELFQWFAKYSENL